MKQTTLSIIILNHNTKDILVSCLNSIELVKSELPFEVIVSDNDSTDGSVEMVKSKFPWVKVITGPNISYSSGNNRAIKVVNGKYILFLNSDTLVHKNTLKETVKYMESHTDVGALSCRLVLPNGKLDKDSRRRFPTPLIALDRLIGSGNKYWYADIPEDKIHEVDAIQGAFFMSPKLVLDQVGWFDENFIFDGEDLDLSFQIKKLGCKIMYYPAVSITHLKKATKTMSGDLKIKRRMQGVDSLEYLYKKNLWNNYPMILNYFVLLGIKLLKVIRFLQIKLQI